MTTENKRRQFTTGLLTVPVLHLNSKYSEQTHEIIKQNGSTVLLTVSELLMFVLLSHEKSGNKYVDVLASVVGLGLNYISQ